MKKIKRSAKAAVLIAVILWGSGTGIFSLAFADEIRYDSQNRRDPFIPLVGPGGALMLKFNPGDLNIEGIIYDPKAGGSLVLINGEFYKEGQSVGKATIVSIFKDRVVLRQDDEEKTLWIREEVVPKSSVSAKASAKTAVKGIKGKK